MNDFKDGVLAPKKVQDCIKRQTTKPGVTGLIGILSLPENLRKGTPLNEVVHSIINRKLRK